MRETEALEAGRIAFIRGQSSKPLPGDMAVNLEGIDIRSVVNSQQFTHKAGHGVDRLQRLCSIEYLKRYFSFVLRRVKLNLNTKFTNNDFGGDALDNYNKGLLAEYKTHIVEDATLSNTNDVAKGALENPDGFSDEKCGVFARDIHPFLRGKCGKKGIVEKENTYPRVRVSRALGDQYAFAALDRQLAKLGLHDWRPDGIVLSKDHAGPDEQSDATFDASLGQLFNVVIQGPAITSNFVGDFKMQAMPGDRVFVLVVCDVMFDKDKDSLPPKLKGLDSKPGIDEELLKQAYDEREALLNDFDYSTWRGLALATSKGEDHNDLLCNFRIQVATSAQMINYSGVDTRRFATVAAVAADAAASQTKIPKDERMGLRLGSEMGEYIVGEIAPLLAPDCSVSYSQLCHH